MGKFLQPCVIDRKYLSSHFLKQSREQTKTIGLTLQEARPWERFNVIGRELLVARQAHDTIRLALQ